MAELNENLPVSPNVTPDASLSNTPEVSLPMESTVDANQIAVDNFPEDVVGPGTGAIDIPYRFDPVAMVDDSSFNGAVDIAIASQPAFDDQPFRDMIDQHAVDMSKYAVQLPNSNMNTAHPGNAGDAFNPFEADTGNFNLNSAAGRKAFFASGENLTSALESPTSTPAYTHPVSYNSRKYEMDRYYHHPRFKDLGFHPFANNDAYYNTNSSKWDNFTRSRAAFSSMFDDAFTSSYRSIADAFSGRTSLSDMQGAQAMDDAMRIGRSSSGGTRGFFNDLYVNSAYTFGIVSNIMVEEAVLALATYFSGGGTAGALATRTAYNAGRFVKALSRLADVKTYASAGSKMLGKLKNFDAAKSFYTAVRSGGTKLGLGMARFLTPETLYSFHKVRTAAKAGENMTNIARANAHLGGFYRDIRAVNLAWSESKMEGGMTEAERRMSLYEDIYKYNNNSAPTQEQLNMIASDARQAAFTNQMINLPIIYLSNKLVLGPAMRGFRPLGRVMDDALDSRFGRIFFGGTKAGKKPFSDLGKEWIIGETFRRMYKAGARGSMKHLAATGLKYSVANFAEGFQELAQEASSAGIRSYYDGLYSLDLSADIDMQLAEMTENYNNARRTFLGTDTLQRNPSLDIMDAVSRGMGSQMSGEGFKVFMSGFLMGGLVQGPQKFMMDSVPNIFRWGKSKIMKDGQWQEFVDNKEKVIANAVEQLNNVYADPDKFFNPDRINLLTQKAYNQTMFAAADAGDILSYYDAADAAIFSHLNTVLATGRMGIFKDYIQDMKKMDDKALKEAFPDNRSSASTLRKRLDKFEDRANEVEKNYDEFNEEFINPYRPDKFEKGTREYQQEVLKSVAFKHAREMALYTKNTFETSLIRSNEIFTKLGNQEALESLTALDIDILTDPTKLVKELGLLEEEVKKEGKTKEEKEQIEFKKKKLELLTVLSDILTNPEYAIVSEGIEFQDIVALDEEGRPIFGTKDGVGKTRRIGRFDRRKIKSSGLQQAFIDYIAFLADAKGDTLKGKDLKSVLVDIIDYGYLKGRAGDYYRAHMTLMNPEYMDEYIERISGVMKEVYEKYTDKNNQTLKLKRYQDKKIRIQWLQTLSEEEGVQPDPDETIAFLERGIIPTNYYSAEGKITAQSDPVLFKRIQSRISDLQKSQSVETAESVDAQRQETQAESQQETEEGATPDFESIVGRSKYQQFYNSDKNTQEILDKLYQQYKATYSVTDGPFLDKNKWLASKKGGKNILQARYELNEFYKNDDSIDKTEYPTMDEWLKANARNPLLVGTNGLLTRLDVDYSDVSPEFAGKGTLPKDKLDATEEVVASDDVMGINLLKTTTVDDNGQTEVVYTIVDGKGNNLYDKFGSIDPNGKYIQLGYTGKDAFKRAKKAYKYYQNNMPKNETFKFAGQFLKSGDIVVDSVGNKYLVKSSNKMVSTFKNIYLEPLDAEQSKNTPKKEKFYTVKQWEAQGFQRVDDASVNLVGTLVTKISQFYPLTIYGFNGAKVMPGFLLHGKYDDLDLSNKEDFEKKLRELTPTQIKDLELLVELNPNYDQQIKDIEAGKVKPYNVNEGFAANPLLAYGVNKYQITIMSDGKPLGIMAGIDQTLLLDVDGSTIDATKITAEQAERLFIKNKGQSAEELAASVRRNYSKAKLITEELKSKLGSTPTLFFGINDLENIELNITPGYNGWRVNANGNPVLKGGQTATTAYEDLESNTFTYNGEEYTIIYDTRKDKRGVRISKKVPTDNLEPGSVTDQAITAAIAEQLRRDGFDTIPALGMGRYVQFVTLPNGTISYFEIKLDALSKEAGVEVVTNIKETQQELLDNVTDDKGEFKTKTDKFDPETLGDQATDKIADIFYVQTSQPGLNVFMRFNKRGGFEVTVKNKQGESVSVFLNAPDFAEIRTLSDFATAINNKIKNSPQAKEAGIKIKLNDQSFVPNLPRNLSNVSELQGIGLSANIIPELKWGLAADLNYTNEDAIKNEMNSINKYESSSPEGDVAKAEDTVEGGPISLNQEVYNELFENNFENIPEEIIEDIRKKIISDGYDSLSQIEKDVAEAYKLSSGVDLALATDNSTIEAATQKDEDGLQAEYNNQDLASLIAEKEIELKALRVSLRNQFIKEFKEANPGQTKGQYNLQALNAVKNSEEVQKLEKEIKSLKEKLIGKIVSDKFDGRNVEEINEFIKWANDNLPEYIQIKDIEDLGRRLISNGITLGAFVIELGKVSKGIEALSGSLYVGKETGFRYHEAFHAVFRMMLSEAEITKFLGIARDNVRSLMKTSKGYEIESGVFVKTMAEARAYMKTLSQTYADMDNKTLDSTIFEEYLADQFELFKINPRSSKVDTEVKSFFQRLIDFIKSIFLSYSKGDLQGLFNDINTGKYKAAPIQKNRFTESAITDSTILEQTGAPSNIAFAIRKGDPIPSSRLIGRTDDTEIYYINNYFTQQETETIVGSITANFFRAQEKLTKANDFNGKYNPKELLDRVIDEYIEEQDPARTDEEGNLYYAEDENFFDYSDQLEERYEGLRTYKDDVRKSVSDLLNLFDTQIEDQQVVLDRNALALDASLKNDEDFEASANEIGGFKSVSKGIRVFFATRLKSVIDPLTGKQTLAPVNYVNTYNTFMKALAGITDPNQMLARLKYFENQNDDTRAVIGDLFAKFNLSEYTLEQLLNGNYNVDQVRSQGFFQAVLKGFTQLRSDYYQLEVDQNAKLVNIFKATSRDDASTQIDNWQDHYATLVDGLTDKEGLRNSAQAVFERIEFLAGKDQIDSAVLDKAAREISSDLFNKVGIDVTALTVKFIILNNGVTNKNDDQNTFMKLYASSVPTPTFNLEDVQEIGVAISLHGRTEDGRVKANLYYDQIEEDVTEDTSTGQETGTDVKFRIKKLAQLNAVFDSTVGATVFRNAEGKLIYAHQMPTYNLEKVAELNSEDAMDELLDNPFLTKQFMLTDPRFRDLVVSGKLRISRMGGVKYTNLEADENGNFKANNKLKDNKNNKTFGDVSGAEFQALAINLYLSDYNNSTGELKERYHLDENGKRVPYATSLQNITVISESNTADFVPLPVLMTVALKNGKSELTDETVERFEDAVIRTETERINREKFEKEGFTEDEVFGYNDSASGRAFKFYNGRNLLSKSKTRVTKLNSLGENQGLALNAEARKTLENRKEDESQLFILSNDQVQRLDLNRSRQVVGSIYTTGKSNELSSEKYMIEYQGVQSSENYSIEELLALLGGDISQTKTKQNNNMLYLGDTQYFVRTGAIKQWLQGKQTFDIATLRKMNSVEQQMFDALGVTEVTEEVDFEQKDVNDQVIEMFEKAANEDPNFDYDKTKAEIEAELGISVRDLIKERLEQEFNEHLTILQNNKTLDSVDKRITGTLATSTGTNNKITKKSAERLNLIANNPDNHNLKQIFYNEWLNRTLFKQILLQDPSMLFKNSVDEIKRAKALNAAGPSAQSLIAAPYVYDSAGNIKSGLGVNHKVNHISLMTFEDIETPARFGRKGTEDKPVTSTDAQLYYTSKAFRYLMFGIGSLNTAQARIMDRVDAGENISLDEFYGAGITQQGYKALGGIMNSKKFVYFDGEVFLKMSAFVLSKNLTSDPETNFEKALPDTVHLHNLRVAMESVEANGVDTIAIAVPASASKTAKKNIIPKEVILNPNFNLSDQAQYDDFVNSGYVTDLSAKYMRLQQITPSNKGTITDPTQIKQLITSEQDNSVRVTVGDKEMSLGEVRALYNKTLGDRVEIKYLQRRNLIFDFQRAQDELQDSIELGTVTVDLHAFLKYAQQALAASGAGPQFMEIFEMDETGSQKYDLNNPITQNKFQQLFLAFFSKGEVSEKVAGDSFALVSNFGKKFYKRALAVDEVGNPTRWEVIRREDYLKNRQELAKTEYDNQDNRTFVGLQVGDIYLDELRMNVKEYDKNGNETGLTYSETAMPAWDVRLNKIKADQPIPDVVAKMFGVRIPSQDKHSAINLKVVDFLPVEYGSSAMFPTELVEISGADFDIDKLYTHFKEFYVKDGEFIEYGATENVDQQYQEYIDYMIADAKKKGTSMSYAVDLWKSRGRITDPAKVNDLSLPSDSIIGALKILSLPVTKDEFIQYKEKFDRLPYTAAQSNEAINLKYAMLGNKGMTEGRFDRPVGAAYEPAVLDPVEEVWNEIEESLPELADLVREEGVIIESPVGMYRSWVNNKAGAGAIGAAVLPNIIVNMLKEYNISLRSTNRLGPIAGGNISINDYNYTSFKGDYFIDPATGKPLTSGDRKQFVISALVTAATDNAKERLLGKLGLNKNALATTVGLVSLGVDLKTAIMLINQPTVREIYARAEAGEASMTALLNEAIDELAAQNDDAITNAKKTKVTTDMLINEIRNPGEIDSTEKLATLLLFRNATVLSSTLGDLQVLSTNTSFDFTSIDDINRAYQKMESVGLFMSEKEWAESSIPVDARSLFDKNKTFQGRYAAILDNLTQTMPSVFVTMSPTFLRFKNAAMQNIPFAQEPKVAKDLLSYFIVKAYMKALSDNGNAKLNVSLDNGFIYDEMAGPITINSVVNNIRTVLKSKGQSNAFMDFVAKKDTNNPANKAMINMLVGKTWTNLNASQVTQLQNGLRDLYAMPELREDVRHIIHYLILKDGLQYARDTFLDIIPVPLLDDILNVSGRVTNLFDNDRVSDGQFVSMFGDTQTELLKEWVEGYSQSRGNIYFLSEIKRRQRGPVQVIKQKSKVKTRQKAILVEENEEGQYTIDINANFSKTKKTKKETRKKGRYQDFELSMNRERNTKAIVRAGRFATAKQDVPKKGGGTQTIDLIGFPMIIKMDVAPPAKPGQRKKADVREFKLVYLYTPKQAGNYQDMIDFTNENIAYGLRAKYEEVEAKGSMQQYDAGFVHGDRSDYKYLQEKKDQRDSATNTSESSMEKWAAAASQDPTGMGKPGVRVNATDKNYTVENVAGQTGNVKVTVEVTDPTPSQLEQIQRMSEQNVEEGPSIDTEGRSVKIKAKEDPNADYTTIETEWDNITPDAKREISENRKISSVEEAIAAYKASNSLFPISQEDWMETLKNCK